jgi:hypothetical protein
MVLMHYKNHAAQVRGFGLELSGSDTVAHLKVEIERQSGVARDRLLLLRYGCKGGCPQGGLPDDVVLETLRNGFGECKVHAYVDNRNQVIPI